MRGENSCKMENKETTILFQGDSISDGARYKDPLARGDLNHQIGHTFIYTIASTFGYKYADRHLRFVNRACSGDNLELIYDRMEEDILAEKPDVFSILAGCNDYYLWKDDPDHMEEFEDTYRTMFDEILEQNPETKLIMCEPFVAPVRLPEEEYKARRTMIEQEIEIMHRISEDYHTVYVPLLDRFDEAAQIRERSYWIWDGVHPTEAGHGLIAHEWIKAVLASGILGFTE